MNRRVLELYEQIFDKFSYLVNLELEGERLTVWPKRRIDDKVLKEILSLVESSGARLKLASFGNLIITFPIKKEDVHEIRC